MTKLSLNAERSYALNSEKGPYCFSMQCIRLSQKNTSIEDVIISNSNTRCFISIRQVAPPFATNSVDTVLQICILQVISSSLYMYNNIVHNRAHHSFLVICDHVYLFASLIMLMLMPTVSLTIMKDEDEDHSCGSNFDVRRIKYAPILTSIEWYKLRQTFNVTQQE